MTYHSKTPETRGRHEVKCLYKLISSLKSSIHPHAVCQAVDFDSMVNNNSPTEIVSIFSDFSETVRHESLWFDDGSVVLCAEQTLFRVHRSVLVLHSEIFAGMLGFPQPKGEMIIEGCSVVCLPDKAADFVDLLSAFYHPLYFDKLPRDASFGVILAFTSGILRLSTKYFIQPLRQKCIDILKTKIPTSYTSLLDLDAFFATHTETSRSSEFPVHIRFSIINLAREFNVPELLPFAFYLCTRLPADLVLKGTSAAVLSWKDKAICLAGRAVLLQVQRTLSFSPFIDIKPSVFCETYPSVCASKVPGPTHTKLECRLFTEVIALESCSPRSMTRHVCTACVEYAMAQHRKGRKEVWDMLPGIFQLGSWEEIRNMQNR